jgi:hypothetical protein
VSYREIIADNLSKAGWSWAASQRLIPAGEQSGLQTRIAMTESVSLCERKKSWLRFVELESVVLFCSSNGRMVSAGKDCRSLI